MAISNQIKILKENWLIVIGLIVMVLVINSGLDVFEGFNLSNNLKSISSDYDGGMVYRSEEMGISQGYIGDDFAPDVSERKIVKTVFGSIEIKRGNFEVSSSALRSYISDADGILINEGVNSVGEGINKRMVGYYSVRVPENKYESFISDVKGLGEIESFNENLEDITGNYIAWSDRLELEKERLERYETLFNEAKSVEEKISISDRIFQQERTIKYLEESLDRTDLRIEYVTISINLNEEPSGFVGVSLVTISKIVKSFFDSLNQVIILIVWIIPWVLIIYLGRFIWKFLKR